MNNIPRQILCVKDMMAITGKSKATIWRISKAIRRNKMKSSHAKITVEEFCEYTGLKEEKVVSFLR